MKDTVVFSFGRFNPPTTGHEKLIEKVAAVASKSNADFMVFPSHSQNNKKDPFDIKTKIGFMKKMFPKYTRNIVYNKNAKTAINVAVTLYEAGYKKCIMVVGGDRVKEFNTLLNKYNGVEARHGFYDFDGGIQIVSAGERDPDAEGVTGMSASKMRAAAAANDYDSFKNGLPKTFEKRYGKDMFDSLRDAMGIKEGTVIGDFLGADKESFRDFIKSDFMNVVGDIDESDLMSGLFEYFLPEKVTLKQLTDLEKFADKLLKKYDIDVTFTRHFIDRVNDDRNDPDIKVAELQKLFKKIQKKRGGDIVKSKDDMEAVIKDIESDLNLPIAIKFDGEDFEIVAKTIMRKKNFSTSNKVMKFESLKEMVESFDPLRLVKLAQFGMLTTNEIDLLRSTIRAIESDTILTARQRDLVVDFFGKLADLATNDRQVYMKARNMAMALKVNEEKIMKDFKSFREQSQPINEKDMSHELKKRWQKVGMELKKYGATFGGIDKRDFIDIGHMFDFTTRVKDAEDGYSSTEILNRVMQQDTDVRDKMMDIITTGLGTKWKNSRPSSKEIFGKFVSEEVDLEEEKFAGWIAIYNGKKIEIRKNKDADDIYGAKQFAIKALKVPKSKQGILAIAPAYEEFVNEESINEDDIKDIKKLLDKDNFKYSIRKKGGKIFVKIDQNDQVDASKLLKKLPKFAAGKIRMESVSESVELEEKFGPMAKQWQKGAKSVKKGDVELIRGKPRGTHTINKGGRTVGYFYLDTDNDFWVVNLDGKRGEDVLDDIDDILVYVKKMVKESTELQEESKVISKVREIVDDESYAKVGGVMVDLFTASAIIKVYDKVNDSNKAKMDKMKIGQLVSLAYKMLKREETEYDHSVNNLLEETELEESRIRDKKSYEAGVKAAQQGKKYDTNPHPRGSQSHLDWSKGHNAARTAKIDRRGRKNEENPCWDGYKQIGMKKKDGKEVPNCVPEEFTTEAQELDRGSRPSNQKSTIAKPAPKKKTSATEENLDEGPIVLQKGKVGPMLVGFLKDYVAKANEKELDKIAKAIGKRITKRGDRYVIEDCGGDHDKDKEEELDEAFTTAIAWDIKDFSKLSSAVKKKIASIYMKYNKQGVKSSKEDGKYVIDGPAKAMRALEKELKQSKIEFTATESFELTDELLEAKFSDKEIKMAFGVLNDKRWKGANMTKIINTIEKIKKGLSKHPSVKKAIQVTNEESDPAKLDARFKNFKEKLARLGYTKKEELSDKQKKIDANKNGKIDGDDLKKLRKETFEVCDGCKTPKECMSEQKCMNSKEEELSDKQKKIDANKNGKIDGDDLKKLRKEEVCEKCGENPCVCECKEETLNSIDMIIEASDKEDAKEFAELVREIEPKIKIKELQKQVFDMAMDKYNNKTRATKISKMVK
jgi:hypothetical protein